MEFLRSLLEFILHIDKHLKDITTEYQSWTYLILFAIIFCETGLVVTPFLPGDSLLFAAGSLAGLGSLNVFVIVILLFMAAFLGDNTNYFIGNYIGPKVFTKNYRFLKKEYLIRTEHFYEKHGGKAVVIARFIPIIRTFAPFVAGVGSMTYKRFLMFCILGNILWISIFTFAGYAFCQNEFVKTHFSLVTIAIIFLSLTPIIVGFIRHKIVKDKLQKK